MSLLFSYPKRPRRHGTKRLKDITVTEIKTQQRADRWQRLSPLLLSCAMTGLSTILLVANIKGWAFATDSVIANYISSSRATVSVVVQIIATVLAFVWTYSVCTALNLVLRSSLAGKHISVDRLRLYVSLSKGAYDLSLPFCFLLISLGLYGVGLVPSWLWTGALTPQYTEVSYTGINSTGLNVMVANTSTARMPPPKNNDYGAPCQTSIQDNGTFSNCVAIFNSGSIINTLGSADAFSKGTQNRSKLDNTAWTYKTRSYGAGASVGYFNETSVPGLVTYNFSEVGFITSVQCAYNTSANWAISDRLTNFSAGSGIPNLFLAEGRRPNDNFSSALLSKLQNHYPVVSLGGPNTAVAFSAGGCCSTWDGRPPYYLSIAAGSLYSFLDQVQCNMTFRPAYLTVAVEVGTKTIRVEEDSSISKPPVLTDNQRYGQVEWALRSLQGLTMVETTTYHSTVGAALLNNVRRQYGSNFNPSMADSSALPAIEYAIASAMDDIFGALSSFALTQNHTSVPATLTYRRVVIGDQGFHIGTLIMCGIAFIAIAVFTVWTRVFSQSPAFDFADLAAMMLAVRIGSGSTGTEMSPGSETPHWTGSPTDEALCQSQWQINTELGSRHAPSVILVDSGVRHSFVEHLVVARRHKTEE